MGLRLERVTEASDARMLSYCAEHGLEHDASFLPGHDFGLSPDYPAYLLLKEATPVGAVVLMRSSRYVAVRRGRFSILHSALGSQDAYSMLLGAIRPHFEGLRTVYMFLPEKRRDTGLILTQLGFHIERYSFVLRRQAPAATQAAFPSGCIVQHLAVSDRPGIAEFAECVNAAFSHLEGHIDSSADDIGAWFEAKGYLEGGICLLRMNHEPIGTICVMREDEDSQSADISALGVLSGHRGVGLGRALLRYAITFALGQGLHSVVLSVNAANEAALTLYKSEGFVIHETMVCYSLDCT